LIHSWRNFSISFHTILPR